MPNETASLKLIPFLHYAWRPTKEFESQTENDPARVITSERSRLRLVSPLTVARACHSRAQCMTGCYRLRKGGELSVCVGRMSGEQPLSPDTLLEKVNRPALECAGIVGKIVGSHTFRHSLATNLRSLGIHMKVAQELLRHAHSRVTLHVDMQQGVSPEKQEASRKAMDVLLGVPGSTSDPQVP